MHADAEGGGDLRVGAGCADLQVVRKHLVDGEALGLQVADHRRHRFRGLAVCRGELLRRDELAEVRIRRIGQTRDEGIQLVGVAQGQRQRDGLHITRRGQAQIDNPRIGGDARFGQRRGARQRNRLRATCNCPQCNA